MRWADLVAIEPRLLELFAEARAVRDDGDPNGFCANEIWYHELKPRLRRLVGHYAQNDEVSSSAAYDLAYQKVYRVLPGCRGRRCGCL